MKLLGCCLKRFHSEVRHRVGPPNVLAALRHHHHRWKAAAVHADGSSDPHLRLHEAVVSALAGAVKEENDRPLLLFCPRVRNEDLIFVLGARDGYGAVEKTRLWFPGFWRYRGH